MNDKKRAETLYNMILHDIVEPELGKDTTYGDDLEAYMKKMIGNKFKGVFPSDLIPKKLKNNEGYIANLDTSDKPGSHWIMVYKDKDGTYFYDSFARHVNKFKQFKFGRGIKNTELDAEQVKSENNCGARCVTVLLIASQWGNKLAKYI